MRSTVAGAALIPSPPYVYSLVGEKGGERKERLPPPSLLSVFKESLNCEVYSVQEK